MGPDGDVAADGGVVHHVGDLSLVADNVPHNLAEVHSVAIGHPQLIGDHILGHIGAL